MDYIVVKENDGNYSFADVENNKKFRVLNLENINNTILECNETLSLMEEYLDLINMMEDNNMDEYHPYIHGVWHDTGSTIKVILTHEQNTILTKDHPELLSYVLDVENNVSYFIENGYVYIYVNYFEDGHRDILESHGALIFDNNE